MRLASRHSNKIAVVNVSTPESELQFNVPVKSKCKFLFDLVVSTLGLRETWYFGLLHVDSVKPPDSHNSSLDQRHFTWLKLNKTLPNCKKSSLGGVVAIRLHFLPKLYPEVVERDLIQTTTRHLFYLHVRQQLMGGGEREKEDPELTFLSAPPTWTGKEPSLEEDLALAAFTLQSEFGDFEEAQVIPAEDDLSQQQLSHGSGNMTMVVPWLSEMQLTALPASLTRRLTPSSLALLKSKYRECIGMHREEAEVEYLKVALESGLVGLTYFTVTEKQKYLRGIAVSAHGLQFFISCNRQSTPARSIPWAFITHISVKDRKFSVKLHNSSVNMPFPVRSNTTGAASSELRTAGNVATQGSGGSLTPGTDAFFLSRSYPGLQSAPQKCMSTAAPDITTSVGQHHPSHHRHQDRTPRLFCFHGNEGSHSSCGSVLTSQPAPPSPAQPSSNTSAPPTVVIYENNNKSHSGTIGSSNLVIRGAASTSWGTNPKRKLSPSPQPTQRRSTSISEVSLAASVMSQSKKCLLRFDLPSGREAVLMLDLCAGQSELYHRWRQSDTVEIQQMRNVAKEEKRRREMDATRLARITHEKESALRVRHELESRCADLEKKLKFSHEEQQKLVSRVREADVMRKKIEHYLSTGTLPQVAASGMGTAADGSNGKSSAGGGLFQGGMRNGGSLGRLEQPQFSNLVSAKSHHEMAPYTFSNGRRHLISTAGGTTTGSPYFQQPATILEASHYAALPEAFLVDKEPEAGTLTEEGETAGVWWPAYGEECGPMMHPGGSMPVLRAAPSTASANVAPNVPVGVPTDGGGAAGGSRPMRPWQQSQSSYTSPLLGGTLGTYLHKGAARSQKQVPAGRTPFRLLPAASASHLATGPMPLTSLRRRTVLDYPATSTTSLTHLSTEQLRQELANERTRFQLLSEDFVQNLSSAWQQWHRAREVCCPHWNVVEENVAEEFGFPMQNEAMETVAAYQNPPNIPSSLLINHSVLWHNVQNVLPMTGSGSLSKVGLDVGSPQPCEAVIVASKVPHLMHRASSSCTTISHSDQLHLPQNHLQRTVATTNPSQQTPSSFYQQRACESL